MIAGGAAAARRRWPLLLLGLAIALTAFPAQARTTAEQALDDLAAQYAPRIVVRDQPGDVCGEGEQFQPTSVEAVLARPDVVLRLPDGSTITAPTTADLARAPAQAHLDLPGDPLDPGCDYAQWFAPIKAAAPPTLYARFATDPGHPGLGVLQYWFSWPFNDWNNKHEGDWEMVQLTFPAATAQEALVVAPESVAFAQHEGSEVAAWDASKLWKDGDHPVVYPSQGSHAAYFDQSLWFGKSAAAGFGCDDTSVDARIEGVQWDPAVVVVPTEPEPGDPRFGWLTYQGRWGQQAPSVNNGPTGPIAKTQWDEPVAWQLAEGRADAVALPPVPGPAPAAFCSLTTSGSLLFLSVLDRPWATALAVLAVVGLIAWSVIATTWTGSDPGTLDRERAAGQLVVAAFGAWRRRIGVFAVLGGLFLVGRFAAGVVRSWAFGAQQGGSITDTAGRTDGLADIASRSVTVLLLLPLVCFLATAAMAAVHRQTPTVGLREALRRAVAPSSAFIVVLLSLLALAVVSVTLVLLPLGAVLLAIWAVAAPAAMLEGRPPGAALRRSAELTKGRRLRTLGIAAAILLGAAGTAPVVGALLLLLTSWPFVVVDTLVAVLAAVLVPVAGVALMLLAYDLRRRFEREHLGEAVAAVR